MNYSSRVFSQSYAEAREKFLAAAQAAGIQVVPHIHPMLGRDGEQLSIDVARFGAADAARLLILTSGCHGVEGFCGSGVQIALLTDAEFHTAAERAGVAVLYIHALNPHGFSCWRRTTHENVDLNRNFVDFSRALPSNRGYEELARWIVPQQWPPSTDNEAMLADFSAKHGARALQQAISGGQYNYPDGIFFGGRGPTWSHQTLRRVLRDHGTRCERLAWIDFHTGLGPSGVGEHILACRDDAVAIERARACWGPQVTSIYDGTSSSALLEGLMWFVAYEECPQAEYAGIALEYGTVPLQEMIDAVRGDQWLQTHPDADARLAQAIKERMRDAFYTNTDTWKQAVVVQGKEAARRALDGLLSAERDALS